MRLIDADAMLANGFKNKTVVFNREDMLKTDEYKMQILFEDAQAFINSQPTVCDIEQIRAEIERRMQVKPNNFNQHDESDYDRGLYTALNIIDKYTK